MFLSPSTKTERSQRLASAERDRWGQAAYSRVKQTHNITTHNK